jgi:hypothetical protein
MPRGEPAPSPLVLAELYDSGDAAFLRPLLAYRGNLAPYQSLIERWKRDRSNWARRTRMDFALRRDDAPRLIFKRLFKQAWHDADHELMGAFMLACDRMIRRKRRMSYRFSARLVERIEVLRVTGSAPWQTFSRPTRHYLRRRVWRYFRRLGFREPTGYVAAVSAALVRYTDDDVRSGEALLDNWGLMHACFGKSPALAFDARHTNVRAGASLAQLDAAPMFEKLWAADAKPLMALLLTAQCRPVRVWATQLLKRLHAAALATIEPAVLLSLLDHADPDVASFGASILADAESARSFSVDTWIALLGTRNPTVAAAIVEAFRRHVDPSRLTFAQTVALAKQRPTPVALLGTDLLESRPITPADHDTLARLAGAECDAIGTRAAVLVMRHLNMLGAYRLDAITALFDSPLRSMRHGAFDSLADDSPGAADPALWARLFESPYDDVRGELVDRLRARQSIPGASADSLASLWQGVLLNIHRGGRAKLSALRQISDRMTRSPDEARTLLPVLAVAMRSVRAPEQRHGLAALVAAVERVPALAEDVSRHFPELSLERGEAA